MCMYMYIYIAHAHFKLLWLLIICRRLSSNITVVLYMWKRKFYVDFSSSLLYLFIYLFFLICLFFLLCLRDMLDCLLSVFNGGIEGGIFFFFFCIDWRSFIGENEEEFLFCFFILVEDFFFFFTGVKWLMVFFYFGWD